MEVCPLTNHYVDIIEDPVTLERYYENKVLGPVKWASFAWISRESLTTDQIDILKGLIRNRQINKEPPLEITIQLIENLKDQKIPYDFESRTRHFLQYLYNDEGRYFKEHDINTSYDCSITYSSIDEFDKIIKYLVKQKFIDYEKVEKTKSSDFYKGLHITKEGINEVEKGLPKMPLFGLVEQQISSGDQQLDDKIEHARKLFFDANPTIDKMRSACETLIFIMEPIRKELDKMFTGDTDCFFKIVNQFDIRHNKHTVKRIEFPEQLEWIFYSLLNTINTYVKMKNRA